MRDVDTVSRYGDAVELSYGLSFAEAQIVCHLQNKHYQAVGIFDAVESELGYYGEIFIAYDYLKESYSVMVDKASDRLYRAKFNYDQQQERCIMLQSTIVHQLEANEHFAQWYYYMPPSSHLHHKQQEALDRVLTIAHAYIESGDYLGLYRAMNREYKKAHDNTKDGISEIWNAAATCLFYIGVDTNADYCLGEGN
jgi:hypothetical protein